MVSSKALIRAQWKAGTILHQILYQICILHYSMEVQLLTSKFNLHKLVISCPKWASSFASLTPLCFFLTCHSLYLLSLSDKYSLVDNISPVLSVLEVTTQRSFHGVLLFCNYSCEIKKKKKKRLTYSLVGIQAGKLHCPIMAFSRIFLILFVVPVGTISVGKSVICKINLEDKWTMLSSSENVTFIIKS